ncbi:DUF2283 domain-containing protein [Nanoarchaeota archaeon]
MKQLNAKGIVLYDFENDILLFKVKERDYSYSVEYENIVFDIDTKDFLTGIQIFDASKVFNTDKISLKNLGKWNFTAKIENGIISVNLTFETITRNKVFISNLVREATSPLKDSEVICAV